MTSSVERNALWQEFLTRWPRESLENLTLAEYSEPGNQDSFCNWLEARTTELGSVWGGSSFKFGVYLRNSREERINAKGRCFNEAYGWMQKYGDSPEEAFESVKAEIIKVANAAYQGNLKAVDNADLGEAIKWKLAFLYQDQSSLKIVPLYKSDYMRLLLETREKVVSRLQDQLVKLKGNQNVWDFAEQQWQLVDSKLSTELTPEQAMDYLNNSSLFKSQFVPTQKLAGFEAENGRQLALVRDNRRTTLFLSPGAWIDELIDQLEGVTQYPPEKSRNSNLRSQAPSLCQGNSALSVILPTLKVLGALCERYTDTIEVPSNKLIDEPHLERANRSPVPLNQIFFGPPGTGKTYSTINAALEILEPQFLVKNIKDRDSLKARFDDHVKNQHIRFVTFHQSFSYEDFVEGLSASTEDGVIRYEVKPGIFSQLCEAAVAKVIKRENVSLDVMQKRVWKMSLGNTLGDDAYIFDECIAENKILLGYGRLLNFTNCKSRQDVYDHFVTNGRNDVSNDSYDVTSVTIFVTKMQVGDLVVVSDGNYKFRAVGEITSDYFCVSREEQDDHYAQCRSVRWLRVYQPSLPHEQLLNKSFSQMTIYQLKEPALDREKLAVLLADSAGHDIADNGLTPHVLIIDEINRGNISKIFGELITLIEPSKRFGQSEALEVILPYSKKQFSVPSNVYIIGTMNTSDRSLAGLDIALRRRFIFKEMAPKPELLVNINIAGIDLSKIFSVMNERIEVLLGRDYCLGHSYFMSLTNESTIEQLAEVFQKQILPLLQEYFFEDWQRIQWVLNDHRKNQNHFIVRKPNVDMDSLFGLEEITPDHQLPWVINEESFLIPSAYQGIIQAEV